MNQSFRSGASLHALLTDAPVPALLHFLASLDLGLTLPSGGDDATIRQQLLLTFGDLETTLARKLDDLAKRLLTLAKSRGAETLRKVAQARLVPEALAVFNDQPDGVARAIHALQVHCSAFEDAESLQHAQHYRDYSPIFSAFDAPIARDFVWNEASERELHDRIVAVLKLDGPVRLSHLEVAEEGEAGSTHVVIIRHGGPLASVATHGDDGSKGWLYFRPSTEATLIYSPRRGIVEVCAPSPSMRQDVAVAFAEVGLGQDLSNKPLSFKLYNLSRFRASLVLPHHQPEGLPVERVSVVEVDLCLEDRRRRLTLRGLVGDDIEAVAETYLGSRHLLRRHPVARVVIAVEYRPARGRKTRTLKITLSEPNRCNLRGNPDAELRKLGYDLLEHWGVLTALRTLGPHDGRKLLPSLLELYDLGLPTHTERDLQERGFDVAAFSGLGFIEPAGRQDNMLVDEDDGSPELVEVGYGIAGTGEFEDFQGGTAWQPKALVTKYRINRDWILETILKELFPDVRFRAVAAGAPELHRLGELQLGDETVVCYLARSLSIPAVLRNIDDHLRGGATPGVGLVLSAGAPSIGFVGSHVVLDVHSFLRGEADGGALDLDALRLAYRSAKARARNGSTVELAKAGGGFATLHMPGKTPLTLIGEKQVAIFEKLVDAYRDGVLLVPTARLVEGTGSNAVRQSFGGRWKDVENVYLISPSKGYWQLGVA